MKKSSLTWLFFNILNRWGNDDEETEIHVIDVYSAILFVTNWLFEDESINNIQRI